MALATLLLVSGLIGVTPTTAQPPPELQPIFQFVEDFDDEAVGSTGSSEPWYIYSVGQSGGTLGHAKVVSVGGNNRFEIRGDSAARDAVFRVAAPLCPATISFDLYVVSGIGGPLFVTGDYGSGGEPIQPPYAGAFSVGSMHRATATVSDQTAFGSLAPSSVSSRFTFRCTPGGPGEGSSYINNQAGTASVATLSTDDPSDSAGIPSTLNVLVFRAGSGGNSALYQIDNLSVKSDQTEPLEGQPEDGFAATDYRPESLAGHTPYDGIQVKSPMGGATEPSVNLANGEFLARLPIATTESPVGESFSFDLTHRSIGNAQGNPALSWGWDANWLQSLERDGNTILHHTGTGRIDNYTLTSAGYEGPPGSYAKLLPSEGGMRLVDRDGNQRIFEPIPGNDNTFLEDFEDEALGATVDEDWYDQVPGSSQYVSSTTPLSGLKDWRGGRLLLKPNDGPCTSTDFRASLRFGGVETNGLSGHAAVWYGLFSSTASYGENQPNRPRMGATVINQPGTSPQDSAGIDWMTTSGLTGTILSSGTGAGLTEGTLVIDHVNCFEASFRGRIYDASGTLQASAVVSASPAGGNFAGLDSIGFHAYFVSCCGNFAVGHVDDVNVTVAGPMRLKQSIDAAGNAWNLSYNSDGSLASVSDPFGRQNTFQYATASEAASNPFYALHATPLLKQVTDHAGRASIINYDHATGHITGVKTPGATSSTHFETQFGYAGGHRVNRIEDNEGQAYLSVTYDGFGRVLSETDGEGGRHGFTYHYQDGLTQVKDPNGNDVDWNFLHTGSTIPRVVPSSKVEHTRGLRFGDPASYTTRYAFNSQDDLLNVTLPAGNSIAYEYDEAAAFFSRGNLLKETRTPGAIRTAHDEQNFQASIVTRYTYNSVCNAVSTIVDPRGNDATFVSPNGGVASSARYRTRIFYDVEEASLGDLNGDGITSSRDCRVVKVVRPNVNPAGVPHGAFSAAFANQASVETYQWNARGQLAKHTDASGTSQTRAYYATGDARGFLSTETMDPGGLALATSYTYHPIGAVDQVTDPEGHVRAYAVDHRGRTIQETGPAPASILTKWTYDGNSNVIQFEKQTDAASSNFAKTTYGYDGLDRLTTQTRFADRGTVIDAAILGQGTAPPTALTNQYVYDPNGNLVELTGGSGETVEWQYDERDLPLFQSGPEGATYAYDANGNLATSTDHLGHVTQFKSDGYDRPAVRTDALGHVFVQNYDPASNVVRELVFQGGPADQLVDFRKHFHDESGQEYRLDEWHAVPAGGNKASTIGTLTPGDDWVTTLFEHDARGLIVKSVNDNGHATTMQYDDAGRLEQTADAMGNEVDYTLDDNGNVAQTLETEVNGAGSSPESYTSTFDYDSENRLTLVTNPDSTTKSLAYDGRGNLVKVIDEAGSETSTFYDNADRPWLVRHKLDASANVDTTKHWDAEDRPLRKCDDQDKCTTYTYVPATRLVASETSPILPGVAHGYDAAGNRVQTTYGNGKQITMGYDLLNRRTTVDVTPDGATKGTLHQGFTYDALGRVTHATDNGIGNLGSGVATALTETTVVQQYDTLGRVVTEAQNYLAVHHTRDGVGNVVKSTYPTVVASMNLSAMDPSARVVSRSYDAAERLDRVWDAKGLIADYSYHGNRVVKKEFGGPSGSLAPTARSFIEHDSMRRPESVLHKDAGGTVLAGFETRYDSAGNRVAEKHLPLTASEQSQLLNLDSLSRATSWKRGSINAALDAIATPVKQSAWSPDGRNEWATWSPSVGTSCTRSTTAANDLQETCGSNPTVTYDRDANGNLHDDGTYVYHWDFLNRLVRVDNKATGNLVVGYGYDAFDRRVVKVYPGQSVTVAPLPPQQGRLESWYTYVGPHAVQESRPVSTGGAAPPSAVHVIRQWTYGSGVDEALEMSFDANGDKLTTGAGDPRHYYHYDALGSVIGLTNEAGHLVEGYTYDPYGGITIRKPGGTNADVKWDASDATVAKSPSENIWFFTGRQLDPETNTYHYRARQYHPGLGQFISMDPIGAWGDEHNLGNPYAYVGNNPSTYRDPSGYIVETLWDGANCLGGGYMTWKDFKGGNWGWGTAGALGTVLDCAATAVPFVPGGVSAVLKTSRAANTAVHVAQTTRTVERVEDAASATNWLDDLGEQAAKHPDVFGDATSWSRNRPTTLSPFKSPHGRPVTSLGPHPQYLDDAVGKGWDAFSMPSPHFRHVAQADALDDVGNMAGPGWQANKRHLDRVIGRGNDFHLSNAVDSIDDLKPGYFRTELRHLESQGYRLSPDGRWMMR